MGRPRKYLSAEERRKASRAYSRVYRQNPKFKVRRAAYEKERRKRPDVQEYYRNRRPSKMRIGFSGSADWCRLKHANQKTIRRIIALERFWAGEDYEFPYCVSDRDLIERPAQDLREFVNGDPVFVSLCSREDLKGLGVYYNLVDELLQKAAQRNREVQLARAKIQKECQRIQAEKDKITTARDIHQRWQAYWDERNRRRHETEREILVRVKPSERG